VPLATGFAADNLGLRLALLVPAVCYAWIACYGLITSRFRRSAASGLAIPASPPA
jgi:fucose permease